MKQISLIRAAVVCLIVCSILALLSYVFSGRTDDADGAAGSSGYYDATSDVKFRVPRIKSTSAVKSTSSSSSASSFTLLVNESVHATLAGAELFFPIQEETKKRKYVLHAETKNKKIACLVSGFMRRYDALLDGCPTTTMHDDDHRQQHKQKTDTCRKGGYLRRRILEPLDCDIFVSTWDIVGLGSRGFHDYDYSNKQRLKGGGGGRGGGLKSIKRAYGRALRGVHVQSYRGGKFDKVFEAAEKEPRTFLQVRPTEMSDPSLDSTVGLMGNTEWKLSSPRAVAALNKSRIYETKRFLRRNDYSQAYKQYCAMLLAELYSELLSDRMRKLFASSSTSPGKANVDDDGSGSSRLRRQHDAHRYEFYFRMRPDLKPRLAFRHLRFGDAATDGGGGGGGGNGKSSSSSLTFQLINPLGEHHDVVEGAAAAAAGTAGAASIVNHIVDDKTVHVHNADLSDFILFATRSAARSIFLSIWNQLITKTSTTTNSVVPAAAEYETVDIHHQHEIDHQSSKNKKKTKNVDGSSAPPMTLKKGTFAEYNLMFWRSIFDAKFQVDDGNGYMKMDVVM